MTGLDQTSLVKLLRGCVTQNLIEESTAQAIEAVAREMGQRKTPPPGDDQTTGHPTRKPGSGRFEVSELLLRPPDPEMTFETLVSCKANEFPLDVARTVSMHGAKRPLNTPLYVYSDIGLGKTHLLSAIYNSSKVTFPVMVDSADLESELGRSIQRGYRMELRRMLCVAGILLVDDIQLCELNEQLQRELFSVLNHRIARNLPVVISCDVPPTRLAGIEKRLLSRLDSGVIVELQLGEKLERQQILHRFFGEHAVSPQVLDYLAEHVTDSVRRLKAAVSQLLALHRHGACDIDLELARAVVPLSTDLMHFDTADPLGGTAQKEGVPSAVLTSRFKEMLAVAQSQEEQALALQIAVGERLRQLRKERGDPVVLRRFEQGLALLREGKMREAMGHIGRAEETPDRARQARNNDTNQQPNSERLGTKGEMTCYLKASKSSRN